jgi:hypothetical protein
MLMCLWLEACVGEPSRLEGAQALLMHASSHGQAVAVHSTLSQTGYLLQSLY